MTFSRLSSIKISLYRLEAFVGDYADIEAARKEVARALNNAVMLDRYLTGEDDG